MNTTLQQMNRGMEVCPLAKDRAISGLVMKTVSHHATEPVEPDIDHSSANYGDENDNPSAWSRKLRAERKLQAGRDMANLI